jgi:hypothetical protein
MANQIDESAVRNWMRTYRESGPDKLRRELDRLNGTIMSLLYATHRTKAQYEDMKRAERDLWAGEEAWKRMMLKKEAGRK